MAITFGGDDTPPGMFSGTDETKKDQRWCSSQRRANASRSNSSPKVGNEWRYICASIYSLTYQWACPIRPGHIRARRHLGFAAGTPIDFCGQPIPCIMQNSSVVVVPSFRVSIRKERIRSRGEGTRMFARTECLTSQLMASPAMAENPVSHNQRRTSVVASTPACSGALLSE